MKIPVHHPITDEFIEVINEVIDDNIDTNSKDPNQLPLVMFYMLEATFNVMVKFIVSAVIAAGGKKPSKKEAGIKAKQAIQEFLKGIEL